MGRKIENEIDYLVAQAQNDTDIAREIVDNIKKAGDSSAGAYYDEKLAQKMLDFFKHEEKMITLYAEAKTEYPILAELIENKRPYLKDLLLEAKKLYGNQK